MLNRLELTNFSVFESAGFAFGEQINVLHGTNGTGKSHVLKLAYVLQHALASPPATSAGAGPSKAALQRALAEELVEVFLPDSLGRLARRGAGRSACSVSARFSAKSQRTTFGFSSASQTEVRLDEVPEKWLDRPPVFIPSREVISIFPGFVSLYDNSEVEFDRTVRDLCSLLEFPVARGMRVAAVRELLPGIEEAMGGRVELDNGNRRFYLVEQRGRIEMHLVAEGVRKLAMLARLVANGSLIGKGCLLWDEPETNLNPRLIVRVAELLCTLASQGVQIFIATHSLFLMREIHIRSAAPQRPVKVRYFGLQAGDGGVSVAQGWRIEDSGDIAALDESLNQSSRYMDLELGAS